VRLLAYSSIAQAGYMLLPFALVSADHSTNELAFSAAVTYILIYAIMTLGSFAVVIALSRESRGLLISDFAGWARRAPIMTVAMTTFMVSLAGIPPTAGFWAKFLVFRAAIDRGGIGVTLAVVMLVNSVVSIYYYLAIPRSMIFSPPEVERPLVSPVLVTAVVAVATAAVVAIGVYPELLAHFPPLSTLVGV
jgi:NADH-quinone oxidoreductase subunit N